MKKWSFQRYFTLAGTIPMIAVITLFCCYLSYWQITSARQNLIYRGYDISHQLSHHLSLSLFMKHPEALKDFLVTLPHAGGIKSVTLVDANKKVINFSGIRPLPQTYTKYLHTHQDHGSRSLFFENDDAIIVGSPIRYDSPDLSSSRYFSDIPDEFENTAIQNTAAKNVTAPAVAHHDNQNAEGIVAIEIDKRYLFVEAYKIIFTNFLILFFGIILIWTLYQRFIHKIIQSLHYVQRKLIDLTAEPTRSRHPMSMEKSLALPQINIDEFQKIDAALKGIGTVLEAQAQKCIDTYEKKTIELEESLAQMEVRTVEIEQDRKLALTEAKAKSDLVAGMHYEIKAPVNSLISFVELLAETHLSPFQNEYLAHARIALRQLTENVTELVEAMLFDSRSFTLACCSFDLRECIDEVLLLLSSQAYKNNIEIIPLVYSDVPTKLLGDNARLKQLLLHFCSVLLHCSPQNGLLLRVFTEYEQNDKISLRFEIIALNALNAEVEFNRLQTLYTDRATANNLNFSQFNSDMLAKKIVAAMNSQVSVEYGQKEQKLEIHFKCKFNRLAYPDEPPLTKEIARDYRVLLFDENPFSRAALALQCRFFSMHVIEISYDYSFETLVEKIMHGSIESFDLILLGFNDIKHEELLQKLMRKLKTAFDGPILVAVNTAEARILEAIEFCGADYCLIKPVSYKKFYHALYEQLRCQKSDEHAHHHAENATVTTRVKALVADDNPTNLQRLIELLQEESIHVMSATSSEQALRLATQHNFDIIYLDIKMPELDGYEIARRLRTLKHEYHCVPIIAVSAYLSSQDEERILTSAINDYLTKPVRRADIHSTLVKWLPKHKRSTLNKESLLDTRIDTNHYLGEKSYHQLMSEKITETNRHAHSTGIRQDMNNSVATPILNTKNDDEPIWFKNEQIIDWPSAVECSNGSEQIARDIFNMLLASLDEFKSTIHAAYLQQDYKKLLDNVHKLHGSAAYCGVPRLKEAAFDAEKILKNGDNDSLVPILVEKILFAIDELLLEANATSFPP